MSSKYHARKTVVDGITFDSKLEAQRYSELKLLEMTGEIEGLTLQPEYVLIPSFKKNGKTYRKTVYRADFRYVDRATGKEIVEDVKGYRTPEYRLKKKLFEWRFPGLTITEITKG